MALTYQLTGDRIRASLDALAARDGDIARAVDLVGYPAERRRPAGFDTLMRIIVAQQLSTKAAAAIYARLEEAMGGTVEPAAILAADDETLRGVGFSRPKIAHARGLAEAVVDGRLDFDAMRAHDDQAVAKAITALKGFGIWSAHIYLMFSLGRPDIWPDGDLAVRVGLQRIKGLEDRLTPKQTVAMTQDWSPHRSAAALLCWHYYSNAPI